ncbi:hypothetical protein GCM10029963_64870 [Micromonospora andamanensis]
MSRTDRAMPVCPGPAGQVAAAGPGRRLDLPRGGRLDGPLTGHRGLATARPDGRGIVLGALRHPTRGRLDRMRQAGRPAVVLGEGRLLVRARSARLPWAQPWSASPYAIGVSSRSPSPAGAHPTCPVTVLAGSDRPRSAYRVTVSGAVPTPAVKVQLRACQARRVSESGSTDLSATLRRIERAAGALATASVVRMDETLPWFRELPADQRSWVMLVAQAGARSLVQWLRAGGGAGEGTQEVSDEVFATAPQALARSITLQQTVALIKVTIDVVEEQVGELAAPGEEPQLREAVLRYSREIAFAAARVYARAAESRGSWDARLQALLVDALLRGDSPDVLASRAAALGWTDAPPVAVAVGPSPAARSPPSCTPSTGRPGGSGSR